ncbi:MAG: tyrosine-type recombinase/integrase [Rhizobiales bacterium]|nr:tyrosine-type recombinase/integrase [Hyphomicrobiales bacterium]
MRTHLTERFVKSATPAANGLSPILRDTEVTGFGLQVRPSGKKSFTLDYAFESRKRRLFIGEYPDWSVTAAREEAKRLKREIDLGRDPLAQRDERRIAPTFKELSYRYLAECSPRLVKASQRDRRNMLHNYVLPKWGHRKVADIRPADVDQLLAEVAKGRARPAKQKTKQKRLKPLAPPRPTPIQANRLGMLIRKMFNLAIRWEWRKDNPASGFIRNPEHPRERFLDHTEIARLSEALAEHPNQRFANIIRMLMLTGARRGEVLNARWEQFDLERAVWTKPAATTKQKRQHRAPISGAMVALLRSIRTTLPQDNPWVFPGDAEGKPIQEIKRFWDDIRAKAGLEDVRAHDLRHTFASLLVSDGMTLPMIGRLLGHTQVQTTQRYAHLYDDPLRIGLERIGEALRPKLRLVQERPLESLPISNSGA